MIIIWALYFSRKSLTTLEISGISIQMLHVYCPGEQPTCTCTTAIRSRVALAATTSRTERGAATGAPGRVGPGRTSTDKPEMLVASVERFCCRLPLTERQDRILPPGAFRDIRVVHLCKVTLDDGEGTVGWGEQTQKGASDEQVARVVGKSPALLLNDDSISIGLQMALFDALGKALGVPCHALLGTQCRDSTPISWWVQSASPADWTAECIDAVAAGYTTCKVKARPWWDVVEQVRAVSEVVPAGFHLDLDFNETLQNVAVATLVIQQLEQFESVAFIESPIPQTDAAGNAALRQAVRKPLAGHFGRPPHATVVKDGVFDAYVIGGGKSAILRQAELAADAGMPFWLQNIGTGLTTAWSAHLGAVLSHATWPTITCVNLFTTTLLTAETNICVADGYQAVPNSPGLGVEVDEAAVRNLSVGGNGLFPPARVISVAVSPNGGRICFAQTETKASGIVAVSHVQNELPRQYWHATIALLCLPRFVESVRCVWYCRLGSGMPTAMDLPTPLASDWSSGRMTTARLGRISTTVPPLLPCETSGQSTSYSRQSNALSTCL